MAIYDCDPSWPVCIYDFSFKNRSPNYFAFKVEEDLTKFIVSSYFSNDNM